MGKPGLAIFNHRRKSQGNTFEGVEVTPNREPAAPLGSDPGGFRLMSRSEVEDAHERKKEKDKEREKEKASKFPRFSSFGGSANKTRNLSLDDDSPLSSKRYAVPSSPRHANSANSSAASDSKSSNGTHMSARCYTNGQHSSTSTLPSSADASSDDNLFAGVPRPQLPQHNSSPSVHLVTDARKPWSSASKTSSGLPRPELVSAHPYGRDRALTASSSASTAIPPKLDDDLNFGDSTFGDMLGGLSRKDSLELPKEATGRSLLVEKRSLKTDSPRIDSKLEIESPLDSRGSAEHLIPSSRSDNDSPPPHPPPDRFSSYARIASESPTQMSPPHTFQDMDAELARSSYRARNPYSETMPEPTSVSHSSSSVNSYDTPFSSRPASKTTNTTPKASLPPVALAGSLISKEDLFTPAAVNTKTRSAQQPVVSIVSSHQSARVPPPSITTSESGKRVMTQAEFREQQKRQQSKPTVEESSDDEDYEDEEDAIKKREEEEIMRRKNQQMHFAREAMRRSTTAPISLSHLESSAESFSMGFPSETSIKADEWEDEDVPLGILAQHGFPSQARNRLPKQPANAIPSHFPERPASTGAINNRASQAHLPAFARNLPADPYVGSGLVRPSNRESMGFNGFARGPASIAGDSVTGGMGNSPSSPMIYQDAGLSQPSLVDQIQMRDMTKQKYMGGASHKKPQAGPFTGMLGQRMNAATNQAQMQMRMSQMPMNGMNGMNGMNPMMSMMGGPMPMMGTGMNQMGYPMLQQDQYMQMQQFQQMQQMIAMQQMQLQQMQQMQQQPLQQDPRMTMYLPNNSNNNLYGGMMGNGSLLNIPGISSASHNPLDRPMSYLSMNGHQAQPQHRPISSFMGLGSTYTPSIAPSERSNIGLSARYRTVVNQSDSVSNNTSSMTLQASGGANQNKPGAVKGILRKVSPQPNGAEDSEDWSKMAARKNKSTRGKENHVADLEDLTRGLNL